MDEKSYQKELDKIEPLHTILEKYQPDCAKEDRFFMFEFVLWAMVELDKLDRRRMSDKMEFEDNLLNNLTR